MTKTFQGCCLSSKRALCIGDVAGGPDGPPACLRPFTGGTILGSIASYQMQPAVLPVRYANTLGGDGMTDRPVDRTVKRSKARYQAAKLLHTGERYLAWMVLSGRFAREHMTAELPHVHFCHETVLLRQLKDVDMQWQHNKIENLKIASQKLDGLVVYPGQTFSYWKLIGGRRIKKVTSTA